MTQNPFDIPAPYADEGEAQKSEARQAVARLMHRGLITPTAYDRIMREMATSTAASNMAERRLARALRTILEFKPDGVRILSEGAGCIGVHIPSVADACRLTACDLSSLLRYGHRVHPEVVPQFSRMDAETVSPRKRRWRRVTVIHVECAKLFVLMLGNGGAE